MKKHLNVLVVEDSEDDTVLLLREIRKGGYDPAFVRVETAEDMLVRLNDQTWDVVISDYSLPQFSAPEALKVLQGTGLDIPFIIVSGKVAVESTVEVLTAGAHDFIRKNSMTRLIPAIERELSEVIGRKEHKKTDEALKESEKEIRTLYSSMNEGVVMHEIIYGKAGEPIDYRILNANPVFESITGIKIENAIGAKGSELYGTGEPPYLDIYAKVAASGEPITFESTFEPMGKSFKISVFSSEKGKFATLFADITERKLTNIALEKSEKKYRTIIENSNDMIWSLDAQGNFTFFNKRSEELTGYKLVDWIGKNFEPLIHEGELQKIQDVFYETMAGNPQQYEVTITKKDGADMILSVNTVPVFESGEVVGSISFARDVTGMVKAEQALHESEMQYRALFEGSPDAIFLADPETGTVIDANSAASKLLQRPIDEIIGFHQSQLHPPGIKELSKKEFKSHMIGDNINHPLETLIIRSDGIEVPVDIMTQIVTINGKPVRQGIFHDITKRKKNEDRLKLNDMRMKALLDLSQMTDSSFSNISDFVLEKIVRLSKSEYGFVGLMNEDESAATIYSWLKEVMDVCAVDDKSIEFPIETAGIWGDAIRERKVIIVNDYSDPNIHKTGLPEGHVPLSRILTIPTFEDGKIVAVAAVANKNTDYDDSDIHQITLLMDGMWKLVQRKQSEEKLKQAANEWESTFDSITDPVSIQDRDFKLVRVNKAFANAMNANPDDLIGKFCFNVVHDTDECIPDCPHKQTLETKQPATIEVFESRLGKHLEVSTSPIFDDDEEVIGSVHIIHDITKRKAAEEDKRNYLIEKTRTELQNFVVSALPVFASGTTPQTRNILVSKFTQNFEDNVLPEFNQEMDDLNKSVAVQGAETTDKTENLSQYLSWLQHFFTNLGAQPRISSDGLSGNIEFSNCYWQDDGDFNPVFCLICRAMVLRSFSWTDLKGRVTHSETIADGSSKCRFDIVLLPGTDVIDSSE